MSAAITTVEFERPTLPSQTYLSELGDDGPPYTISGVALGAGDVTKGKSGIKKMWPAEELRKAADSLEGTSLVVNHENTAEGVVGRVTKAGYKDGTGVIYEAELYDEDLAEKIENGLLEVSVRGLHADVDSLERDEESGAIEVEDIEFKNLSIVPSGAAPSNTVKMGEQAALSEAELSEFTETLEAAELEEDLEPSDWVKWGDKRGIIVSPTEGQEEVEVDVYEKIDGKWRSTGTVETVDLSSLERWDVSEDDIGARKDDEGESSEEEENAAVERGQFVKWRDVDNDWRYGQIIGIEADGAQMVATLRRFTESGDRLDETETRPVQGLEKWDTSPLAESDSDGIDAPEWTEGQMVQWQVNPAMKGKIVHVDDEKKIVMVEVMENEDGQMVSSGFTVTAGYSDLEPVDDMDENATTTKDVPTQSAEPDHEPMGSDDRGLGDITLKELLRQVDELTIHRGEGEEEVLDDPESINEMKANSPERFLPDDIDYDKVDVEDLQEDGFDDYPEAAKENAQMALDAREETGNPNDCGTEVGWRRAKQLANGEALSREQLGKMSAFARHEGNSEMDDEEGRADCGWMMWKAWGGDEGIEWAQRKLDSLEEEASSDEGEKTGDSAMSESSDAEEPSTAELQEYEMHEVSWDATTERDWSSPDLEDFMSEMDTDAESWDDLTEDQKRSIGSHFIISESGFPADNYGDMNLPVVEPNGDLNVNALAAVKGGRGVSAVEGLDSSMEEDIVEYVNGLARREFDKNWGKEEEENAKHGMDPDVEDDKESEQAKHHHKRAAEMLSDFLSKEGNSRETFVSSLLEWADDDAVRKAVDEFIRSSENASVESSVGEFEDWLDRQLPSSDDEAEAQEYTGVRVLPGDDLRQAQNGASEADSDLTRYKVHMNDELQDKLSELDEPVAVEAEELEELKNKADRFEEISSNLEELRERTEILDEVDRSQVEELAESDEPVIIESARYEELQDEADQVKSVYAASLAEHMPGDWLEAEELSESFSIEELREKHEDVVGDIEEELSAEQAEPRSQDPDEEELEEKSSEAKEEEELSEEVKQKQEEIKQKILSDVQ